MDSLFASQLSESVIKRLSIRVKELGGVNLGQGIPSFPTADHILEAAKEALSEKDIGVYPNFLGTLELRTAIAKKLSDDHRVALDPGKHILVTVGAMEGAASTISSIVSDGDRVAILTPDYCNHFSEVILARGKICEIPLGEEKGWSIDFARIEKEAKKGLKLLLFTNPSNPTGAVFTKEEIQRLVRLAQEYGFWLVSDETYSFLAYDEPYVSLMDFWGSYGRLVTLRSFSKEYAMTGWRVGYVVAQEDVIAVISKTHDAFVGCVPKISQIAATTALTGSQDIVRLYKETLAKRRTIVCKELDMLAEHLTYIRPRGSYYVFPKYKGQLSSLDLTENILTQVKVGVVPGSVFGESGEGHIRISFAVDDDILIEGMKRLRKFFTKST